MTQEIVLASTSPFRKELLDKLQLVFSTAKSNVDETPLPNETAIELTERLAIAKAKAVAPQFPDALIIGSDQVALNGDTILGKPHTHENATKQLQQASGKCVTFYTGLCLYNASTGKTYSMVEPYEVHFRNLSEQLIERYLIKEKPYKCAGSFKSEALGICLFSKLSGKDPNSLIGLPLISLIEMLEKEGVQIP